MIPSIEKFDGGFEVPAQMAIVLFYLSCRSCGRRATLALIPIPDAT